MMRRRRQSIAMYMILSVGISSLLIHTALPYYCLTSIALPGWNIYWSYADVQKRMLILFPTVSFIGVVTTIKKRTDIQDIFLNIASPLIILMLLKALQHYVILTIAIILVSVIGFGYFGTKFCFYQKKISDKFKKARLIYYGCRKRMIYFLFFVLTPLSVWINHLEAVESEKYLTIFKYAQDEQAEEREMEEPHLTNEGNWTSMKIEERFEMITEFVNYECNHLQINPMDIFAVKEITDGRLGYYSPKSDAIYLNVIYLNSCSLKEAVRVITHECFHCYQNELIECLNYLEEADMNYERLKYFDGIVELKEAAQNYYFDSLSYDTYCNNELEIQAEEYSGMELERLKRYMVE